MEDVGEDRSNHDYYSYWRIEKELRTIIITILVDMPFKVMYKHRSPRHKARDTSGVNEVLSDP